MMTTTNNAPTRLHGCDTVVKLWRQQCLERGAQIAHREKDLGIWQSYSWRDYYEHARAIGVAQSALDLGLSYAQDRKQFGRALIEFPRVSGKLAMMAVELMVVMAWAKDSNPFIPASQ